MGFLAGRPHRRLARSFLALALTLRMVVFCLRWQRDVRPLYKVQYLEDIVRSLLIFFGLGVPTPSWARARIFPPKYVRTWDLDSM